MTVLERAASAEVVDDIVLPFAVESLSTRGRLVRLGPAIDQLLKRHDYPEPVSKLVAEAVALAALLGSTLKMNGRFQLQTKSDGPVTMLLVDFDAPSHLRALARFDRTRLEQRFGGGRRPARPRPYGLHHRSGRRDDTLSGRDRARGSGIGSRGASLFRALGADPDPGASRGRRDRHRRAAAHGAPAASSSNICRRRAARRLTADFDPGDAPEGVEPHRIAEDDAWTEAKARAATTEAHELIDPTLSGERLLFRLFNERGVRVYEPTPLAAVCRCSAEGVDAMLRSFPPHEVKDMVGDDGMIGVTCEFCSTKRVFDPADYGA